MATIPSITRTIDDAFLSTWYEIQAKATDNILDSNVVLAALRAKGCFKPQTGGPFITRTIRYGKTSAITVKKGDILPTGDFELETAAHWTWRYISSHVQRSLQDDQVNNGPGKIKDLVQNKLEAVRDALEEKFESCLLAAVDTTSDDRGLELRASRDPYSLFNVLPGGSYYNQAAGTYTYGGIDTGTGNPWWQGKYTSATSPAIMNMEAQLRTQMNASANGSAQRTDLMITDQTRYEAMEDIIGSKIQITSPVGKKLAELGYESLVFKGSDVVWTGNTLWPTGVVMGLCTSLIDIVYDPSCWFSAQPWVPLSTGLERIMRIVCTLAGVICYGLRRQWRVGTYTS